MMPNVTKPKPNFLRIVEKPVQSDVISSETFVRPAWQSTFFANENPSLLLFVNFAQISEADFDAIITGARPKFLIDLRRVPRFDLGKLNRRQAFAMFASARIQYFDLSGKLGDEITRGALDAKRLAQLILDSTNQTFVSGPIAFLVDSAQFDEASIAEIIDALPSVKSTPWDVLRMPISSVPATDKQSNRKVIFISHANPQDNGFTTWLAGQLTLAGYAVWSDVTKLVGGETFWDDIETLVREEAAKVVVVLSKDAQTKPGVLDEIDLAVRVERSFGLPRFVLPIRIDALPYSDVRANIARKTIIDFRNNWAAGLYSLLNTLERDRVPRTTSGKAHALARWVTDRCAEVSRIVSVPEKLITNWLPIEKLPDELFFYGVSFSNTQIEALVDVIKRPRFRYLRLIGSFASNEDLQTEVNPQINLSNEYRISTLSFLEGKQSGSPGLSKSEARKAISNLLRQAWDAEMGRRGLRAFETASGSLAWYMPQNLIEKNRVYFLDETGKRRHKLLVGWSERRKVFWHFAVEARPVLSEQPHFVLKQHVVFTPNGLKAVESKERMHVLRRRFCKNWWNERWRDLLIAYVSWLSADGRFWLETGSNSRVELSSTLMRLDSPVSIAEQDSPLPSLDRDDDVDELDSDDDFASFDDEELMSSPPESLPDELEQK